MDVQRSPPHTPRFPLRVGILSAAGIVNKTWPALHQAGHNVTWIGCRDVTRGEKLAKDVMAHIADVSTTPVARAPQITEDYEQVVSAADVDVVYLPIPTALRDYWVRRCILHGKHVVGEKPAASTAAELYDWLTLMAPRRLLYMDGTMLTHGQRVYCVESELRSLGPLHHIDVNFSFLANPDFLTKDIRVNTALEPQGALGDLGWYAVRWILHLVQFALPTHVSARVLATTPSTLPPPPSDVAATAAPNNAPSSSTAAASPQPTSSETPASATAVVDAKETGGAITAFEGHLTFPSPSGQSPITATFVCSFNEAYEQSVRAYARDGTVVVNGAINPTCEAAPSFSVERARWAFDDTAGKQPLAMTVDVSEGDVKPLPPAAGSAPLLRDTENTSTEVEEDTAYQIVQLWRDVGDALIRLGRDEPILIHPEKGKHWTTVAYMTQYVLDQLLGAAEANAKTVADEDKQRAEAVAAAEVKTESDAAAKELSSAKGNLTVSPRRSAPTATGGGETEEKFPFALF